MTNATHPNSVGIRDLHEVNSALRQDRRLKHAYFAPNTNPVPNTIDADSYYESPDSLDGAKMGEFTDSVVLRVRSALAALADPENTVLALYGVASLFGFLKVSEVLPLIEGAVRGRLLVFFPGVYEQNNYRLLDARDGWNYLAFPITASDGESRP